MESFSIRPGYGSGSLLVEFLGDHCSDAYPDVGALLASGLDAVLTPRSQLDVLRDMATGAWFSSWRYPGGEYELDDDGWCLFIHAPRHNQTVIADIERALLASGSFIKKPVDFAQYRRSLPDQS